MKKINYIIASIVLVVSLATVSCKKQFPENNPNFPNPATIKTENGIILFGTGGIYTNGFRSTKYGDGVIGESFISFVNGFHGLLGDEVTIEAANIFANQVGCPDKITLDNATQVLNPGTPNRSTLVLRAVNLNSNAGSNPFYYEWHWMYSMINSCNAILGNVNDVPFIGDGATKKNVMKAWAYWWKGFAYSRIGSMYYAGIVRDDYSFGSQVTNGNYKASSVIIAESNKMLDSALNILAGQAGNTTYTQTLAKLIPDFCQVGKGLPPTPAMWIRNCNTLKARNILVNKTTASMTIADWTAVAGAANNGIQAGDYVFTARSNTTGDLISVGAGTVPAKCASASGTPASAGTYKVSERHMQDYKTGDQRRANNFVLNAPYRFNSDRGTTMHTRWGMKNGGNGIAGVIIYANNTTAGAVETYLAGTYEENALMIAEATMYANSFSAASINTAMGLIDAVRTLQGAGLAPVAGVVTTQAAALEELRKERRSGLAYRGLAFYDARRWKVIDPIASGGGRTGCMLVDNAGNLNTNVTIEYNYLDYWDVPDNELAYNPPAGGSAPVKNPRQ